MARYIETPAVSSDLLKHVHVIRYAQRNQLSDSTGANIWVTSNFTTTTPNATLIVRGQFWGAQHYSDMCGPFAQLENTITGASESSAQDGDRYHGVAYAGCNDGSTWARFLFAWHKVYENMPVSNYRMKLGFSTRDGGGGNKPFQIVDPNSADDNRFRQHERVCMIYECEPSSGLSGFSLENSSW